MSEWNLRRERVVKSGKASKKVLIRYLRNQLNIDKCNTCNISIWRGNKLTLHIDHIDGNNKRNTLGNVRLLCPNCHSQTPTFGVKNVSKDGRLRMVRGGRRGAITKNKMETT